MIETSLIKIIHAIFHSGLSTTQRGQGSVCCRRRIWQAIRNRIERPNPSAPLLLRTWKRRSSRLGLRLRRHNVWRGRKKYSNWPGWPRLLGRHPPKKVADRRCSVVPFWASKSADHSGETQTGRALNLASAVSDIADRVRGLSPTGCYRIWNNLTKQARHAWRSNRRSNPR